MNTNRGAGALKNKKEDPKMARFEVTVSEMQSAASKIGAQADEFLNQAKAVMAAA